MNTTERGWYHVSILLWIVFGALAGWIASMIMGGVGGIGTDIILGIIGAIVGGWLMQQLGQSGVSGFNVYSLVVAVIGAIILIMIGRLFRRSTTV